MSVAEVDHNIMKLTFNLIETIVSDGLPCGDGGLDETFINDWGSSDWQFAFPAILDKQGYIVHCCEIIYQEIRFVPDQDVCLTFVLSSVVKTSGVESRIICELPLSVT